MASFCWVNRSTPGRNHGDPPPSTGSDAEVAIAPRFLATLLSVCVVLAAWSPTSARAEDLNDGNDILGYIGCSMTADTFNGYEEIGATLAWPVGTYNLSGGVLGAWVPRGGRWRGDRRGTFEGYVQKRDAQVPAAVLLMVCSNKKTTIKLADMQIVIGNVTHYSPNLEIYLTSQPRYVEGHLCTNLANSLPHQDSQFAAIDTVISEAVANGWADARSDDAGPCSITAARHLPCQSDRSSHPWPEDRRLVALAMVASPVRHRKHMSLKSDRG